MILHQWYCEKQGPFVGELDSHICLSRKNPTVVLQGGTGPECLHHQIWSKWDRAFTVASASKGFLYVNGERLCPTLMQRPIRVLLDDGFADIHGGFRLRLVNEKDETVCGCSMFCLICGSWVRRKLLDQHPIR